MDNQNSPAAANPNPVDADKSQSMTDACSSMKDEIKTEAQRMVSAQETMGKPQAMTDAVSVMKDEIKQEAEQILAPKQQTTDRQEVTEAKDKK